MNKICDCFFLLVFIITMFEDAYWGNYHHKLRIAIRNLCAIFAKIPELYKQFLQ